MKYLHNLLGLLAGLSIVVILLITSFEIAAYSNFGWYEKEYTKYNVQEDLEMEMPDIMNVTEEMMAYLRGDREDLVVDTVVDGMEREFFNDREKAHMVDVQNMFLGGLALRLGGVVTMIIAIIMIILTKGSIKKVLPKTFLASVWIIASITIVLGMLFTQDFHKYFFLFHEIFFTNDLWLLDPRTDLMIRMLPEGFFFDMVVRIGSIFGVSLLTLLLISILIVIKQKNKNSL